MDGLPDRSVVSHGGPITAIAVVGLMGAGKTTIGRLLAAALGWPLDDSDSSIEARHDRTVRQLRDELGTGRMHELEARHLLDALAATRPRIITPAAFTIEVGPCRDALRAPGVATVWLRADPATLAARFAAGAHRPSYGDDPAVFLAAQAARRGPLFATVHPVIVDVDGIQPRDILERVLEGLTQRGLGLRGMHHPAG
jgi:shikimate kinase